MSYYDDRRYSAPRDRGRGGGSAAEYFDSHPRGRDARIERDAYPSYRDNGSIEEIPRDFPPGRDYVYERSYEARRPRRPAYENVRRASSVSGDPYYDSGYGHSRRSRTQKSRRYDDRGTLLSFRPYLLLEIDAPDFLLFLGLVLTFSFH
jgi:hypothetical protein